MELVDLDEDLFVDEDFDTSTQDTFEEDLIVVDDLELDDTL